MHQYSIFNCVYYHKERENYSINEIHSDLRHVTVAQHLGGGVHVWLLNVYNLSPLYYCFALFNITNKLHCRDRTTMCSELVFNRLHPTPRSAFRVLSLNLVLAPPILDLF